MTRRRGVRGGFFFQAPVARQAPIEDDDLAEGAEHDVLRLEIAMDDAARVRERDRLADALEARRGDRRRRATTGCLQRLPGGRFIT